MVDIENIYTNKKRKAAQKPKVPKDKIPKLFVQHCIIQRMTHKDFAIMIGCSKSRLSQLVKELKPFIDQELQNCQKTIPHINTKEELDNIYFKLLERWKQALDDAEDHRILLFSRPLIDILKTKGLLEKAGITQNIYNIENMTIEQLAVIMKPHIPHLAKIILKYVPPKYQEEASREIDEYLGRLLPTGNMPVMALQGSKQGQQQEKEE